MSFMDDLLGGGGESKSRTYLDDGQRGYLEDMWGKSQDLYNSGRSPVADMSPEMQAYLSAVGNMAGNSGNMSGQAWGQGNNAFGVGQAGGNYLNTLFQNGGFQAPMQNGVNMNTVNGLIDNDLLDSQITASTRDIYRNLGENQMTGIASGASMSGNAGSTRRGVAEGIAMRGANDRAADVAAGIRSNAYNNAVTVAANQGNANQNAMMNTNSLNAGVAQNAFGSGYDMGYQGLNTGYNIGAGGVGLQQGAGNAAQTYAQQVQMAPWQALQLYQGGINAPITLSESTQAGGGAGAGPLLSGIGGLIGGFAGG